MGQAQPFQSQTYPGHNYQVHVQPQHGISCLGYSGGMQIPTAQAILGYPGYPPLGVGLNPQGYQNLQQDPNR